MGVRAAGGGRQEGFLEEAPFLQRCEASRLISCHQQLLTFCHGQPPRSLSGPPALTVGPAPSHAAKLCWSALWLGSFCGWFQLPRRSHRRWAGKFHQGSCRGSLRAGWAPRGPANCLRCQSASSRPVSTLRTRTGGRGRPSVPSRHAASLGRLQGGQGRGQQRLAPGNTKFALGGECGCAGPPFPPWAEVSKVKCPAAGWNSRPF